LGVVSQTPRFIRANRFLDTGSIVDLNLITACKIAWAGFLGCDEFAYSNKDCGTRYFVNTKLTRSDVAFDKAFGYAIIRLKHNRGVEIVLAASRDPAPLFPSGALGSPTICRRLRRVSIR
jgi:hypothetical protein